MFALLPCLETTHSFVHNLYGGLILIPPNPVRHQQIYKLIIDTYISFSDSPMNSLSWSLSSDASKKFPRLGFKQGGRQWACRPQICLRIAYHFTSYVWYRSEEISPCTLYLSYYHFKQGSQTMSLQVQEHKHWAYKPRGILKVFLGHLVNASCERLVSDSGSYYFTPFCKQEWGV